MRGQVGTQIAWPKPSKALIALMAGLVVAYVLQLLLLRAGQGWVNDLALSPAAVFERFKVWQVLTYMVVHDPQHPSHLLFNLLWLYMFGTQLEQWWGARRFLTGFFVFGFGGAVLTLLVGGLSFVPGFDGLLGSFWRSSHLGASGGTMGIVVAWGLVFPNRVVHLLFVGPVKARTIVIIAVAFELLTALSYSSVSSTAHFGGMAAAAILVKGLWRPSNWQKIFRRAKLHKQRKRVEAELKVLEGGAGGRDRPDPKDPKNWN